MPELPSMPPMPPATAHDASAPPGEAAIIASLPATLAQLRSAWRARRPDAAQRLDDLARLRGAFTAGIDAMADAISADFGSRSRHESLVADAMTVLGEIDHLRAHLRGWMRARRVGVGWKLWPARARVRHEALGVVGVMSPWNYPVNLALIPLATAIAAGNHVFLKPSEQAPRTSAWLGALLAEVFPPDRVAVAFGGPALGAAFAALPFDHLVFTGSTAVGRKVMAAAAANLTPLTLELGGKSPAIVDRGFPVDLAASRLATGKWFNAGQTCIAPDYALVHEDDRDDLVAALGAQVRARYGGFEAGGSAAADYTSIASEAQYRRLRGYLDDARARGLDVIELGAIDRDHADAHRLIAPTLVLDPGDDALVMREEIFGPILPLKPYRELEEALGYVESHPRPLALYPFSHDPAVVERIVSRLLAGGVTVNDTLLHFAANRLPFGGVGASGMGAYHGRAGFDGLTKAMPVLYQSRWAVSDLLKPPYRGRVDALVRRLVR